MYVHVCMCHGVHMSMCVCVYIHELGVHICVAYVHVLAVHVLGVHMLLCMCSMATHLHQSVWAMTEM